MALSSLAARVAAALALVAVVSAALTALAVRWLPPWPAALAAAMVALLLCAWLARRVTGPWVGVVRAVRDGIMSVRDHDFSVSVGASGDRELRELVAGLQLARRPVAARSGSTCTSASCCSIPSSRRRRWSMVLSDRSGRVVYSNVAARQLLHAGRKLEGLDFEQLLAQAPAGAARGARRGR